MATTEKQPADYPLPKVATATNDALIAEIHHAGFKHVVPDAEERAATENPAISYMVDDFLGERGITDNQTLEVAHEIAALTHELMRRQAFADSMAKIPTLPDHPHPAGALK